VTAQVYHLGVRTAMPLLALLIGCPKTTAPPPSASARAGKTPVAMPIRGDQEIAKLADVAVAVFNDRPFQLVGYEAPMAMSPSGHLLAVSIGTAVRLFDAATGEALTDLGGHHKAIAKLAFRSDTALVTADYSGDIKNWDLGDMTSQSLPVQHASEISALAVWQDLTVSADTQGNAFIWRGSEVVAVLGEEEETGDGVTVSSGIERVWIGPHGVLIPNGWRGLALFELDGSFARALEVGSVADVAYTDEGFTMLSQLGYKEYDSHPDIEAHIRHYAIDGELQSELVFPVGNPYASDLSDDGNLLAIWDYGSGLGVWDLDPVRRRFSVATFPHDDGADQVMLSRDGAKVAVSSDGSLNIVDATTGEAVVDTSRRGPEPMRIATLSDDGLALMSDDDRLYTWDALDGGTVRSMGISAEHMSLVGDTLIGFDDTLWALHLPTRELLWELAGQLGYTMGNSAAASPDGSVVAYGGYDGEIVIVDGKTGEVQRKIDAPSEIYDLQFSDDGGRVAASYGEEIGVWNAATGEHLHTWDHEGDDLIGWVGETLAVTGAEQIWTLDTRTGEATMRSGATWLGAAFSVDGRWLAWRGERDATWLLDLKSDKRYAVPVSFAQATAIDPRGEHLLVAGADKTVAVFRIADLESAPSGAQIEVAVPPTATPHGDLPAHALERVAKAPDEPETFDYDDLGFRPHTGYTNVAVLSPDGSVLATGGTDDLVRLWRAKDYQSIAAVRAGAPVQRIQFADGDRLVFVARPEGSSPVYGAAKTDGTALWIRDDLAYGRSDSIAILGDRVATFEADFFEFLDLETGAVIGRMPGAGSWTTASSWTEAGGLVTSDGENHYRWDVSWLP